MIHPAPTDSLEVYTTAYEESCETLHPGALFETVVTPEHVLRISARNLEQFPKCSACKEGNYWACEDITSCQTVWAQLLTIAWNRFERREYLGKVSQTVEFSRAGFHVTFWEK